MNFGEYVELGSWNGQTLLMVHDYELLDFLEDHFTDMDIETMQVHPSGSIACYQLLFNSGVSKDTVWQVLKAIDPDEIAQIVVINNGSDSANHGA